MHFKNLIFLLTVLSAFSSCETNKVQLDSNNLLLGNWVNPTYERDSTIFTRSNTLQEDAYGITFKQNGAFIERSSGFCGTPPLIFSDFKGSFELNETLIKIYTDFFPNGFQWRIVAVNENELIVKRELSEQEQEHRELMDLFNELYELTFSETCIDESEWTYTAYGAKACGGPKGYIAYSTKIDSTTFLQKIENYTNAEKAFNTKWGIVSDCTITNVPIGIECKNGYPILIY